MTGWLLDPEHPRQPMAWTPLRATLALVLALAAPVAVSLAERGGPQVAILAVALAASLVWELVFAVVRQRQPSWHGVFTAMIIAVMVPAPVPLWQVALAISFGVVFGDLVFGGRGYGFLSPAAAAIGFLAFSFPGTALAGASQAVILATLPGAFLIVVLGLVSWRVLIAAVAVVSAVVLTGPEASGWWLTVGGMAFALVFLIGDPVAAASTNPGRWLYGLLAGGLIVLFDTAAGAEVAPVALVFASLLASVFAPLIDYLVVSVHCRRRRMRHG